MRQVIFLLALLVVLAGVKLINQRTTGEKTRDVHIVEVGPNDPEMNAAIAEAQRTLAVFLAHAADADGHAVGDATLKVAWPVKSGAAHEHVWVRAFTRTGSDTFAGILDSDIVGDTRYHQGDEIQFTKPMITDWVWPVDATRTLYGGYTMRVLFGGTDATLRGGLRLSQEPLPGDWLE